MSGPIPLDVFADIACPWCFIGHRRLQAALAAQPRGAFTLRHRSFELQPALPAGGMPVEDFIAAKFGRRADAESVFRHVTGEGARAGIRFDFDALPSVPNTRLAHRAVALAREQGFEEQALDALYAACFEEGLDVTDPAIVVTRLRRAGAPDAGAIEAGLAGVAGEEAVSEDESIAAQIRVSAVPVVVAGRRIGFQGAQDAGAYADFLASAAERLAAA